MNLAFWLLPAAALLAPAVPGGIALDNGALRVQGKPFRVRGVGYVPTTPCALARDLPLLAGLGANVVFTRAPLPRSGHYFLPLLRNTGLYWIAGIPVDPSRPRQQVLDEFRLQARQFRGERRLIAFVLGDGGQALAAEASAILTETWGRDRPLLGASTREVGDLATDVPGLDFWSWEGTGPPGEASRPVLIGALSAAVEEETAQAAAAVRAVQDLEARPLLGAVWTSFAPGLMRAAGDSLEPRQVYYRLAALWGGTYPAGWAQTSQPTLDRVENETAISAGSLIRLAGAALGPAGAPWSDETWPLALGQSCLCVDDIPAPLSLISATALTAQIPAALEPGDRTLVFYRAGRASNAVPVRIRIADTQSPQEGRVLLARR